MGLGDSPSQYLKSRRIYKRFQIICRRDLLRMRHARLAAHAPSVIAETILFLFQIAILETFILIREAHREGKGRTREGQSTTKRRQQRCWQRTRKKWDQDAAVSVLSRAHYKRRSQVESRSKPWDQSVRERNMERTWDGGFT